MNDDEPGGLVETELSDLSNRFTELGLNAPTGVCILPTNFLDAKNQSDLFLAPRSPDLKVLLRQSGLTVEKLKPESVKIPFRDDRDNTLILPLIFFGVSWLSDNPHLLNIALGVLANYVTDHFRATVGRNHVQCSIIVEKTKRKTTSQFNYDGSSEGFARLIDAVKKAVE